MKISKPYVIQATFDKFKSAINWLISIFRVSNTSLSCPVNSSKKAVLAPQPTQQKSGYIAINIEKIEVQKKQKNLIKKEVSKEITSNNTNEHNTIVEIINETNHILNDKKKDNSSSLIKNNIEYKIPEEEAINNIKTCLNFSNDLSLETKNKLFETHFEIDIPSYINNENLIGKRHSANDLMAELNYQIQKDRGIPTKNELAQPLSSNDLKQFCKDLLRTPTTFKSRGTNQPEPIKPINIYDKFVSISKLHASYIYYTAQQGHTAEAFMKVTGIAQDSGYMPFQKPDTYSLEIEEIEKNHYQITSSCTFVYGKHTDPEKILDREIATITKTHLRFDGNEKYIPNKTDTLILIPRKIA